MKNKIQRDMEELQNMILSVAQTAKEVDTGFAIALEALVEVLGEELSIESLGDKVDLKFDEIEKKRRALDADKRD